MRNFDFNNEIEQMDSNDLTKRSERIRTILLKVERRLSECAHDQLVILMADKIGILAYRMLIFL